MFQGSGAQAGRCLVEVSEAGLSDYLPPVGITRKGAIAAQDQRRSYHRQQETIDDALLGARLAWQNCSLAEVLADALEQLLQRRLLGLLEE